MHPNSGAKFCFLKFRLWLIAPNMRVARFGCLDVSMVACLYLALKKGQTGNYWLMILDGRCRLIRGITQAVKHIIYSTVLWLEANAPVIQIKMHLPEEFDDYDNTTKAGIITAFSWESRDTRADDLPMMNFIAWPLGEYSVLCWPNKQGSRSIPRRPKGQAA